MGTVFSYNNSFNPFLYPIRSKDKYHPSLHCDRKTTGEALGLGLAKANMYILDLLKSEVALPL